MMSLVLLAALAQAYYTPVEAKAVFDQASEAYTQERYSEAADLYQRLIARGHGSAEVLYNLGTVQLAAGNLGGAVLAFERAKRAGADDPDLEANLALARSRQVDQVVGAREGPFVERLVEATRPTPVGVVFLVAWTAAFALLVSRRFLSGSRQTWALLGALLAFALAVPTALVLGAHIYVHEAHRYGVVMRPTLAARDLPRPSAKVAFEVHEGLKVRLLEQEASFVKIRLLNGLEGWAEREGVTPL